MASIDATVVAALRMKPIGKPVSLRAFLRLSADHGHLEPIVAETTDHAAGWFGGTVREVYALGGAEPGQLTVLVEYTAGETALITAAVLGASEAPAIDLLVIGNHGTLRWDGGVDFDVEPFAAAPLAASGQAVLSAVRTSLKSGAPTLIGEGG